MNSRNPFGKGSKQSVTLSYYPNWSTEYEKLADYIFDLRDEWDHLLRNGRCKTVIYGFTFTIKSVKAIYEELLQCSCMPYKYVLIYKFLLDHMSFSSTKLDVVMGGTTNCTWLQFGFEKDNN